MDKEKYEKLVVEVIEFEARDVITRSNETPEVPIK